MLEAWRNRGTRDPAEIIEADEARRAKRRWGCMACSRRPALMGGNGKCRQGRKAPGCGFDHDGEGVCKK